MTKMINNPAVDKLYLAKYNRTFKFESVEAEQQAMLQQVLEFESTHSSNYIGINKCVEQVMAMGHHLGLKMKAEAPDEVRMIIARNTDLNTGFRGTLNAEFIKVLRRSDFDTLFYSNCETDQQTRYNTYFVVLNITPSHPAWEEILKEAKYCDLDIRVTTPWWFK